MLDGRVGNLFAFREFDLVLTDVEPWTLEQVAGSQSLPPAVMLHVVEP